MGLLQRLFAKKRTPPASARTLGRNEPCWCASGAKYKACHLEEDRAYFERLKAIEDRACRGPT